MAQCSNLHKLKHRHSLQGIILLITLIFTIFIGTVLSLLSVSFYNKYIRTGLIKNTDANLSFMADSINENITSLSRFISFCQTHSYIGQFLDYTDSSSPRIALRAYDRLNEEYMSSPVSDYIHRLIIGNNHDRYLQLVDPSYSTSRNVAVITRKMGSFSEQLTSDDIIFTGGFTQDPYIDRTSKNVLIVIRPISYQYSYTCGGYAAISLRETFFTSPMEYYSMADDSKLFLTLGEHTYLMMNNALIEQDISGISIKEQHIANMESNSNVFYYENGKESGYLITKPLSSKGCYITQLVSSKEMHSYGPYYFLIILVITSLIILIGFLLSTILYQFINVPVMKIQKRLEKISHGDFSRDTSIEWNHELGDIGRGINNLSENIESLMNSKIQDEKDKKDLEYKMLQSQINPHFLYNTLNSIKWMAVTQGADGISEMTTALSRLLRSISKGTKVLIPLRDELSLVNDYFTIQQYRYGGTIKMNTIVEDDSLNNCQIIKFTLQPLVENAIFHGIEPKQSTGLITIHVYRENSKDMDTVSSCTGTVCVSVEDDGVGMTAEQIEKIFSENSTDKSQFFKEVGLINIHKRIQYEFGENYGIYIESEPGCYTRMIVKIPETATTEQNGGK